jgi:hypothetical protein
LLNEVDTVLASPEFSSARQLRDFFLYIARQAAAGRETLDQHDIAFNVLNRDESFDPASDAAVRRLATQLRQRLEKYYAGSGKHATVEIYLPSRSYLPLLRDRTTSAPSPHRSLPWKWFALAACLLAFSAAAWRFRPAAPLAPNFTRIFTQKGDLMGPGANVAPDSIRLGGILSEGETAFVSFRFRPREERQQAGLILFQGPDDYVRLGRFFGSHTTLEFAQEVRSHQTVLRSNSMYDASGQTNRWLHLAIERRAGMLHAYTSPDGTEFIPFGEALPFPETFRAARVGIFAFNGRRDSPSVPADFGPLRRGILLSGRAIASPAWLPSSSCPEDPAPLFVALHRLDPKQDCIQRLDRAAPAAPWTLETHLEKASEFGSHLGIGVRGTQGNVSLSRYFNKQPVLAWIWHSVRFESIPDYPGSPPVYLRLRSDGREVWGESSPDGEAYDRVGTPIPLARLGNLERQGLTLTYHAGHGTPPLPGFRVNWLALGEETLRNFGREH